MLRFIASPPEPIDVRIPGRIHEWTHLQAINQDQCSGMETTCKEAIRADMEKLSKTGRKINPKSLDNLKKAPRWQPGQSGNPSGKSKSHYDIMKAARKASPEAFQTIVKIAKDPKASAAIRLKASEFIIERAFGRAANPLHMQLETPVNHRQDHLAALVTVNEEVRREQLKRDRLNGVEVIEEPGYLIDTSADDAEDTQPE